MDRRAQRATAPVAHRRLWRAFAIAAVAVAATAPGMATATAATAPRALTHELLAGSVLGRGWIGHSSINALFTAHDSCLSALVGTVSTASVNAEEWFQSGEQLFGERLGRYASTRAAASALAVATPARCAHVAASLGSGVRASGTVHSLRPPRALGAAKEVVVDLTVAEGGAQLPFTTFEVAVRSGATVVVVVYGAVGLPVSNSRAVHLATLALGRVRSLS